MTPLVCGAPTFEAHGPLLDTRSEKVLPIGPFSPRNAPEGLRLSEASWRICADAGHERGKR